VFTISDSKVVFRSSYFAQNSVSSSNNYAVVVEDDSSTGKPTEEVLDGGGENLVVTSGNCDGFFVMASKTCKRFGKREREENVFITRSANATLAGNSTGNMPN
jgi:hypothetical protein